MAKVLLINSNRFKHPWPVIPFELCYIATVLETNGNNNVCFLDLCFSADCENEIQKAIRNFIPDVIGSSLVKRGIYELKISSYNKKNG